MMPEFVDNREKFKRLRARKEPGVMTMSEFFYWRDMLQDMGLWDKMIEDAAATREQSRVGEDDMVDR